MRGITLYMKLLYEFVEIEKSSRGDIDIPNISEIVTNYTNFQLRLLPKKPTDNISKKRAIDFHCCAYINHSYHFSSLGGLRHRYLFH